VARPKLAPQEQKSLTVSFRLTPIEHAQMLAVAAQHGMRVSELARRKALGVRLPAPVREAKLQADAVAALNRIGVNLNQIAKRMNSAKPMNMERLITTLDRIHDAMDRLNESD